MGIAHKPRRAGRPRTCSPDRASSLVDGEATGTDDDNERCRSTQQWIADRKATEDARAQGRELLRAVRSPVAIGRRTTQ